MKKMFNSISNYKLEFFITFFSFFVLFIIFRIVPTLFDGWMVDSYYTYANGFLHYFRYNLVVVYQYINGRITSNLIMGFIESFKSGFLLDLFNSLVIIGIYVYLTKILNVKNRKKYIYGLFLYFALILLISPAMRKEVFFYACGAYVPPILMILCFYDYWHKLDKENNDKRNILILSLLGFSICTWIEHVAVGFGITLSILYLFDYIKKKNKKIKKLIPILFSALGGCIMMSSPALKLNRTIISENSLIDVIKNNIIVFKNDIISNNILLFFVLFIVILILILKNKKYNKIFKIISSTVIILYLIFFSLVKIQDYIVLPIKWQKYKLFLNCDVFNIYQLLFLLGIFLILFIGFYICDNRKLYFYFSSVCFFSLSIMLLTPNTGARISSIGYFMLLLISILLFFQCEINSKFLYSLIFFLLFIANDNIILISRRIYNIQMKREKIISSVIQKQNLNEWDYNDYVILPKFNENDIHNSGVAQINTFHYPYFLKFYGLNENTKILFKDDITSNINVKIEYDLENINIRIINGDDNLTYKYIIKSSNNLEDKTTIVQETDWIDLNSYSYSLKQYKYCYIDVYVKNVDNEIIKLDNNYIVLGN